MTGACCTCCTTAGLYGLIALPQDRGRGGGGSRSCRMASGSATRTRRRMKACVSLLYCVMMQVRALRCMPLPLRLPSPRGRLLPLRAHAGQAGVMRSSSQQASACPHKLDHWQSQPTCNTLLPKYCNSAAVPLITGVAEQGRAEYSGMTAATLFASKVSDCTEAVHTCPSSCLPCSSHHLTKSHAAQQPRHPQSLVQAQVHNNTLFFEAVFTY